VADPGTPEEYILRHGVHSRELLDAALSRPGKSAALIAAILSQVCDGLLAERADAAQVVDALLGEPQLSGANVKTMAYLVMIGRVEETEALLTRMCTHPRCSDESLLTTLWNVAPLISRSASMATGQMVAATSAWLRRLDTRGSVYPTTGGMGAAHALAARWDVWVGGDESRRSFLLSAWFYHDEESTMFTVGEALTAGPALTMPRQLRT